MTIYVVKAGDNLNSIARQFGVTRERIITDNVLPNPDRLVVGQSLGIRVPQTVHTVAAGETLASIAQQYGVSINDIRQNNPRITTQENLPVGEALVITFQGREVLKDIRVNGYAYPFIDRDVLRMTLPFLTNASLFTYGFTPEGNLLMPDDTELVAIIREMGSGPLMVLTPMTAEGNFDSQVAHQMFVNTEGQNRLIDNIIATMQQKGYVGLDIDFEFILPADKQNFLNFITNVHTRLQAQGLLTFVALAPKTSGTMTGLLYEAHDYPSIGAVADFVLLLTYEWGYTYSSPMATSPINNVRSVLQYAVSVIDRNKILMGIPNYAYDWPLPYVKGQTAADSITNQEAILRASQYGVNIQFDEQAQSPFYNYTDAQGIDHEVWFDDVRSMNAKLRLINEFNLAGGGVWHIMNFFPGLWLVVNNLYTVQK